MADADEPDEATEDGDDPEARELVSAPQHVVHERSHERRSDAADGSAIEAELAGSSAATQDKVLARVMSSEATNHQSEVAGVHRLGDDDGRGDEEDVEQEHPDRLEEAGEQAEERAERRRGDEDERLVLAPVEMVRNLCEERRHEEDADRP